MCASSVPSCNTTGKTARQIQSWAWVEQLPTVEIMAPPRAPKWGSNSISMRTQRDQLDVVACCHTCDGVHVHRPTPSHRPMPRRGVVDQLVESLRPTGAQQYCLALRDPMGHSVDPIACHCVMMQPGRPVVHCRPSADCRPRRPRRAQTVGPPASAVDGAALCGGSAAPDVEIFKVEKAARSV